MRQKINLVLVGGLTFLITYNSTTQPTGGSYGPGPSSLILHGIAYFALAGALLLYFQDTEVGHVEAMAFAALMGLGLEIFQYFLPFRTFALYDVLANSVGASLISLDHRIHAVSRIVRKEDQIIRTLLAK